MVADSIEEFSVYNLSFFRVLGFWAVGLRAFVRIQFKIKACRIL